MGKLRGSIRKWALRYIKYNIIGIGVFLINLVLFVILFNYLGEWAYIVVSVNGGIIEFILISYVNRKKHGVIFDSCPSVGSK